MNTTTTNREPERFDIVTVRVEGDRLLSLVACVAESLGYKRGAHLTTEQAMQAIDLNCRYLLEIIRENVAAEQKEIA